MADGTTNPGQELLTEIKSWFKDVEKKAVSDIEEAGTVAWHILTTAIAKELPQLPGIVAKAVIGASSATGSKMQSALNSILADLKATGIQSLESAATGDAGEIGAALGIDGNTVTSYVSATVTALRTKGLI